MAKIVRPSQTRKTFEKVVREYFPSDAAVILDAERGNRNLEVHEEREILQHFASKA